MHACHPRRSGVQDQPGLHNKSKARMDYMRACFKKGREGKIKSFPELHQSTSHVPRVSVACCPLIPSCQATSRYYSTQICIFRHSKAWLCKEADEEASSVCRNETYPLRTGQALWDTRRKARTGPQGLVLILSLTGGKEDLVPWSWESQVSCQAPWSDKYVVTGEPQLLPSGSVTALRVCPFPHSGLHQARSRSGKALRGSTHYLHLGALQWSAVQCGSCACPGADTSAV